MLKRAFPTCSKILVFDHIARHHARYDKEKSEGEVFWQVSENHAEICNRLEFDIIFVVSVWPNRKLKNGGGSSLGQEVT